MMGVEVPWLLLQPVVGVVILIAAVLTCLGSKAQPSRPPDTVVASSPAAYNGSAVLDATTITMVPSATQHGRSVSASSGDFGFTYITADRLPSKVAKMAQRSGFVAEFERLAGLEEKFNSSLTRSDAALLLENKNLNRYSDVLAKDHSRVKLRGEGREYINANYIDGYVGQKRVYIAAQGPLLETVADFWSMVWQESSSIIIMIGELEEDGKEKCCRYWPDTPGATQSYSEFVITYVSDLGCLSGPSHTARQLKVARGSSGRVVTHFQYTGWADQGVPKNNSDLFAFCNSIDSAVLHSENKGPLLVHCSAGLGRTGVLIALRSVLQQLDRENAVDIFATVLELRRQRAGMVQTSSQYQSIFALVLWYLENLREKPNK